MDYEMPSTLWILLYSPQMRWMKSAAITAEKWERGRGAETKVGVIGGNNSGVVQAAASKLVNHLVPCWPLPTSPIHCLKSQIAKHFAKSLIPCFVYIIIYLYYGWRSLLSFAPALASNHTITAATATKLSTITSTKAEPNDNALLTIILVFFLSRCLLHINFLHSVPTLNHFFTILADGWRVERLPLPWRVAGCHTPCQDKAFE